MEDVFITHHYLTNMKTKHQTSLWVSRTNRFLIGLAISLSITLMAFEWTSVREEIIIPEYDGTVDPIDPTELPPVTYRKKFTPPAPPKKDDGPIFDIVDDPDDSDEKKDEDFEEPDLDNLFDPDEYGADGDDLDPEFHPKPAKDRLEVYPHLDVCKDLKGKAMEDCSKKAIAQLIKTRMKVPSILFDIGEKQGVMMSFIV